MTKYYIYDSFNMFLEKYPGIKVGKMIIHMDGYNFDYGDIYIYHEENRFKIDCRALYDMIKIDSKFNFLSIEEYIEKGYFELTGNYDMYVKLLL